MDKQMTETDRQLNTPGTMAIGDRLLTVGSLSTRAERSLYFELAEMVAAEADPFQRIAPVAERLLKEGKRDEHAVLIRIAAQATVGGDGPGPDTVMRARRTNPRVLCRELYRRAKPHHPELTEEELLAVITKANAEEVWMDFEEAMGIQPRDPKAIR
jgi:hypothetical protein